MFLRKLAKLYKITVLLLNEVIAPHIIILFILCACVLANLSIKIVPNETQQNDFY